MQKHAWTARICPVLQTDKWRTQKHKHETLLRVVRYLQIIDNVQLGELCCWVPEQKVR